MPTKEVIERFKDYDKEVCWQRHIREQNLEQDLKEAVNLYGQLSLEEVQKLRVSDFNIQVVNPEDITLQKGVKKFIQKHEWLGKIPPFTCNSFSALYKGHLGGVIILSIPCQPATQMFGKYATNERLICRGACISWSPKNLGSAMVTWAIKWMANNTKARIFTAYSDPEAKELGTTYQACNFIYMGQDSGSPYLYYDHNHPHRGWINDRIFRMPSMYKFFCKELKIKYQESWFTATSINKEKIPEEVFKKLKKYEHWYQNEFCDKRVAGKKHKYMYIKGINKTETREIKAEISKLNPKMVVNGKLGLPYPKERGK